jgi:N-acetylmuramoyl-L-alanine amidase
LRTAVLSLLLLLASALAFSQATYRRVVARRGDNTYTLLRRHGLTPATYQRAFLALNRAALGKNKTLVAGRRYRLPPLVRRPVAAVRPIKPRTTGKTSAAVPRKVVLPLTSFFGKSYGAVPSDGLLRGAVFYLSSGHGGPDPGAMGKYGSHTLAEDEYAYDVTLRLARVLYMHGALVYLIIRDPNDGIRDQAVLLPDYDEVTYPSQPIPRNQLARLRQRINAVNALYPKHKGAYQRFLGLHVDSRSEGKNIDVFFYHNSSSAVGKRLAQNIHKMFTTRYKRAQPNRPYSGTVSARNTLFVVRNSRAPAVFMELGNIRNAKDQRRFLIPDNRQAMANWMYEGILADYRSR